MIPSAWILFLTVFLAGAVISAFLMVVIGIHATERARRLTERPATPLDVISRATLGVGVRTEDDNQ